MLKAYATTFESLPGTVATVTVVLESIHPVEGVVSRAILDAAVGLDEDDLLNEDGEFDEAGADYWIAGLATGEKGESWGRVGPWRRKGKQYHCEVA